MKIFCIGRNYADHAKELNNAIPTEPLIFMKPPTALLKNDRDFYIPEFSNDVHHELELVLRICKNGKHVQPQFAKNYYDQITVGIDFTARDVQAKLKAKGHPWEIAKGFDGSAVLGKFIPYTDKKPVNFRLNLNDNTVQQGTTKDMIFDFDTLVVHISKYFTLQQGDLIYTGTPAGVGAVNINDKLVGYIENEVLFNFKVK